VSAEEQPFVRTVEGDFERSGDFSPTIIAGGLYF
jgi:hypothetical protein